MADFPYYGTYARFDTLEKKDGAILMNADSIVGDRYEIEIARENGTRRAWLKNRFGARVGFFDEATTHELSLCEAKGWTLVGILSFAAFSEMPEPSVYWGQAAIIAYDELHADVVEPFIERVRALIGQGVRPQVSLGPGALEQLQAAPDSWMPTERVDLPAREKGTVILKSRQKVSEKLIEQGRQKNIGCYIVSWLFLLGVVALLVFGLKSCGLF